MALLKCAISGLSLHVQHVPMTLSEQEGYYHPIFALPYKALYSLYIKHCKGQLTAEDSYLLFLAFLHSTDSVEWRAPANCDPQSKTTTHLIENNIRQLISVIERTALITHPSFKQPGFVVAEYSNSLLQIPVWISSWQSNIDDFMLGQTQQILQEQLVKVENRLSYMLLSGMKPEQYAATVANWADKAADFPEDKAEYWKQTIRSSFSSYKMFSTPLSDIKEIKNFCVENIEAGSIHFHALMKVLNEGINRNLGFLGAEDTLAGYKLLPAEATKNQIAVEAIIATAPEDEPKREDYATSFEYIRARLKYRLAIKKLVEAKASEEASDTETTPESTGD